MTLFSLRYTVTARTQTKTRHHADVHHTATLTLDNQEGGPVKHWCNVPHQLTLPGEDIPLGTTFTLTLTRDGGPA